MTSQEEDLTTAGVGLNSPISNSQSHDSSDQDRPHLPKGSASAHTQPMPRPINLKRFSDPGIGKHAVLTDIEKAVLESTFAPPKPIFQRSELFVRRISYNVGIEDQKKWIHGEDAEEEIPLELKLMAYENDDNEVGSANENRVTDLKLRGYVNFEIFQPFKIEGFASLSALTFNSYVLISTIGLCIILYALFAELKLTDDDTVRENKSLAQYHMFTSIEIMMFFGFGYLMCFLKRFGVGAVAFTMLITIVGLLWGMLVEGFFEDIMANDFQYIQIDWNSMIGGLYLVTSILITFGAVIGKISPVQMIVLTVIESIFYTINKQCLLLGYLHVVDAGGTIMIHMFGGFFGLTVAWMLGQPKNHDKTRTGKGHTQDFFSLIGTLYLWIMWPAFNGGTLEPNSDQQQRAIIHTILGLCGSSLATFAVSVSFSKSGKWRPVDIQNATLSGGVALGTTCVLTLNMSASILIGVASGIISTFGLLYLNKQLETRLKLHDTCGVSNLHVLPSLVGGISSIILAAIKAPLGHDYPDVFTREHQWLDQLLGMVVTIVFAIVTGGITGFILFYLRSREDMDVFTDSPYWEIMDDVGRSIEGVMNEISKIATDFNLRKRISTMVTNRDERENNRQRAHIQRDRQIFHADLNSA